MTLAFRASATVVSGASPRTVSKPTGTAEGDALLLFVRTTDDVVPASDGFTLVASITGAIGAYVLFKVAGASEPASYDVTFASGGGAAGIMAVSSTVTPSVHQFATRTNGTSSNRTWDGVTNTVANTFLACFGSLSLGLVSTPDAAMTERWDVASPRIYAMTQDVAATGDTGTRVATGTALTSNCITVSLTDEVAPGAPEAPTALTATAVSASQIDLTWADNSDDEDGFSVEHSDDGVSGWAEIDTVAAGVETYSHAGLTRGTPHYYRVRAFRN